MKLSIHNFKTIRELNGFNFDSINIISGVNSSGKTSFIQFLLMLKQTLEALSANPALIFGGNWIKLGSAENLIYKKDKNNSIGFELEFNNEQLKNTKLSKTYQINTVIVKAQYIIQASETLLLSKIRISYNDSKREHFVEFEYAENGYKFNSDSAYLVDNYASIINSVGSLNTISFIPNTFVTEIENPNYRPIEDLGMLDTNPTIQAAIKIKVEEVQNIVSDVFKNISYIGPLREEPQDLYSANSRDKSIGKKGEYAAQFFEDEANNEVNFFDIQSKELQKMSLSNAVKYWICDAFNLAKDIKTEKYKDSYIVKVVNHYDVESTIKQVGFGISQVLPIIVEGLRMPKDGILILEQPEIHLHPKVQSMLFDFVYSLSLIGKKFVIETHSDHFITRMRRRVAEDNNNLAKQINLMFVEQEENEHKFVPLDLTNMGTLSYFPDDFVEQAEDDYKAIIKAQAEKRKNNIKI